MLVQLRRTKQNRHSTVGDLYVDGRAAPVCATLEDGWHMVKQEGRTRIPAGLYPLKLRSEGGLHAKYLERFGADFHKGMLHICEVPWFEFVLIHCGNTVDDTRGCVLVGTSVVEPEGPDAPYTLLSSEAAYRAVYPVIEEMMRSERAWFQAIDPDVRR